MDRFFEAPRLSTIRGTLSLFFKFLAFGLLGPATGTVRLSETFESLVILRALGLGTEGVCVTTLKLPPESISFEVLGAGLVVGPTFAAIRVDLLRSIVGSSCTTFCCFFCLRFVEFDFRLTL